MPSFQKGLLQHICMSFPQNYIFITYSYLRFLRIDMKLRVNFKHCNQNPIVLEVWKKYPHKFSNNFNLYKSLSNHLDLAKNDRNISWNMYWVNKWLMVRMCLSISMFTYLYAFINIHIVEKTVWQDFESAV